MKTQYELFPNLPIVLNPTTFWARYRAYLRSARWKEKSEATKKLANYECEYFGPTCEWQNNLDCHHRNYNNVFREIPGVDTMCVCRNYHNWIHSHPIMKADNDNNPQPANDNKRLAKAQQE